MTPKSRAGGVDTATGTGQNLWKTQGKPKEKQSGHQLAPGGRRSGTRQRDRTKPMENTRKTSGKAERAVKVVVVVVVVVVLGAKSPTKHAGLYSLGG